MTQAHSISRRRSPSWPKVGSALWLLKHELRLYFFEKANVNKKKKAQRGMGMGSWLATGALSLFLHAVAWLILRLVPTFGSELPPKLVMFAGLALFVLFTLMLSQALSKSVAALFERGDLDLLLSSPLSSKTIFQVRLAGIAAGSSIVTLFFLTPFAHVGLFIGQFRWLGIYPTIIALAVLSSALGMWMTLGLVRWIGVRKTRVAAQLLGALVGALAFISSQAFGNLGASYKAKFLATVQPWFADGQILGADSYLWVPAKALFGTPLEVLMLSLIAAFAFVLVAKRSHRFFVQGVQQSAGTVRTSPNAASGHKKTFARGLVRNVILKEWRLILRDPQLISQISLQILYMIPLFFVIFRKGNFAPSAGAGLVVLSALLASSLMWVIISAEHAADLLATAPAPQKEIRRAKVLASVLPPLMLIAVPLLYLSLSAPLLAALTLVGSLVAMHNISQINLWMARPADRSEFQRRANGSAGLTILEKLNSFFWAGSVFLAATYGWWALVTVGFALVCLLMAWVFKIEH